MAKYKTEITSDNIPSDNPIHQRLLKPYMAVVNEVKGDVLELGCGEGRGVEILLSKADSYVGIDKIADIIERLKIKFPKGKFEQAVFPPFQKLQDNQFNYVISFQVIEHIKNDHLFLQEIYRVLKPGGMAIISTPNKKMSLSRNPWHEREYFADELKKLTESFFDSVRAKGITGNEKVMAYHELNRVSVNKIMRFDILNLQYNLPSFLLKIPYEILNRMNRNKLSSQSGPDVSEMTYDDYLVTDQPENSLDLFFYLYKK